MTLTTVLAFFLLPLLAGALVRTLKPEAHWLRLLLSFSGAFLLGVVFLHMLPELYAEEGPRIGFWVLGGFLLQVVLEFFSHGIEHGHVHATPGKALPLVTLLSLCLHSYAEGIPFADPAVSGNIPFLVGVLLHKMPMVIALATVLLRSGMGSIASWAMIGTFAVAAPLGILTGVLLGEGVGHHFLHDMLGLAIGMLLHISTTIIFESAPEHRFNAARFVAVLVGAALAMVSMH
ncbi:MAG: ZIP family metal transporter [Flavobacteriales bacterium]|nr:ZIP family metal transporter [Flavobacteriales bacterium]HRH70000.1 ZIP family metal transporter [Flavobacteriales bacterium]